MSPWSFSFGRYFGVEVRLHILTLLLLPVLMTMATSTGAGSFRGSLLWLLLLAAILVRETGRTLACEAAGVSVTRLVLLPTGTAPPLLDDPATRLPERTERLLALAGPLANFAVGLTMALLMYAATPRINLFERPWVTSGHLLRSAIWAQVLLGGLNLLPALPMDAGVVLRRQLRRVRGEVAGSRMAAAVSQGIALILVTLGAVTANSWLVIMGISVVLTTRSEVRTALAATAAEKVTVGEVMLRDFTTVAASDTLADALRRTIPSLQDVFPVVRGPLVVGSVSREALITALRTDPNSYVQSVMARTVELVSPDDLLLPTLRRIQQRRSPHLLPVVQDEHLVGIVTPSHLSQAMSTLGRTRRLLGPAGARG